MLLFGPALCHVRVARQWWSRLSNVHVDGGGDDGGDGGGDGGGGAGGGDGGEDGGLGGGGGNGDGGGGEGGSGGLGGELGGGLGGGGLGGGDGGGGVGGGDGGGDGGGGEGGGDGGGDGGIGGSGGGDGGGGDGGGSGGGLGGGGDGGGSIGGGGEGGGPNHSRRWSTPSAVSTQVPGKVPPGLALWKSRLCDCPVGTKTRTIELEAHLDEPRPGAAIASLVSGETAKFSLSHSPGEQGGRGAREQGKEMGSAIRWAPGRIMGWPKPSPQPWDVKGGPSRRWSSPLLLTPGDYRCSVAHCVAPVGCTPSAARQSRTTSASSRTAG